MVFWTLRRFGKIQKTTTDKLISTTQGKNDFKKVKGVYDKFYKLLYSESQPQMVKYGYGLHLSGLDGIRCVKTGKLG